MCFEEAFVEREGENDEREKEERCEEENGAEMKQRVGSW
jgi:hypothetical protein